MLYGLVLCIRLQLEKILAYCFTQGYASVRATQKILRQRYVEEMRLVGYYVVQDGDDLASLFHCPGNEPQGRREPGHPISYYQKIGFPFPDGFQCLEIRKRISRIQYGLALYRYGFIVFSHILCLAREEDFWILTAEIESLDIILPAQFIEQTGVKLGNTTPERVETGQYGYFQFLLLCILGLYILLVETGKNLVSDIEACVTCNYRNSSLVG